MHLLENIKQLAYLRMTVPCEYLDGSWAGRQNYSAKGDNFLRYGR
jgi:hypothetical protein